MVFDLFKKKDKIDPKSLVKFWPNPPQEFQLKRGQADADCPSPNRLRDEYRKRSYDIWKKM